MEMTDKIKAEIGKALILLGADRDLRSIVGSWRDTMTDEQTLAGLKEWNHLASENLFERLREFGHQEKWKPLT